MGLDMYAFRHKGDMIQPQEKRDKLDGTPREPIQFADWRKHNRLQGFMQELYDKKNGADGNQTCLATAAEPFTCATNKPWWIRTRFTLSNADGMEFFFGLTE